MYTVAIYRFLKKYLWRFLWHKLCYPHGQPWEEHHSWHCAQCDPCLGWESILSALNKDAKGKAPEIPFEGDDSTNCNSKDELDKIVSEWKGHRLYPSEDGHVA